jgi:hypothetical protein
MIRSIVTSFPRLCFCLIAVTKLGYVLDMLSVFLKALLSKAFKNTDNTFEALPPSRLGHWHPKRRWGCSPPAPQLNPMAMAIS